jgi:glycosyltransferase involved in cell wall biosynthesis
VRIGVVFEEGLAASQYRAIGPVTALARRGHQLVFVDGGTADAATMVSCDVVLVYRRSDAPTQDAITRLADSGVAVVYDNDDDFLTMPAQDPAFSQWDDAARQRVFERSLRIARRASLMLATSEGVAERYRAAGVRRVEVVPNYLPYDAMREPVPHEGVVIGWVAGAEHHIDVTAIPLVDALERILRRHRDVRVECIGLDLALSRRYRHDKLVPLENGLRERLAAWDIGLAPLADHPFNRARSDIKLKEYAACGVPWLASPVAPYRSLGEEQGGRLVPDDQWFDALHRLVRKRRDRERMSAAGMDWAKRESIAWRYRDYERLFAEAIDLARAARRDLGARLGRRANQNH